jgi:hypothetical protein
LSSLARGESAFNCRLSFTEDAPTPAVILPSKNSPFII